MVNRPTRRSTPRISTGPEPKFTSISVHLRDRSRERDLDRDFDRDFDLDLDRDFDFERDFDFDLDRDFDFDFDRDLDGDFDLDLDTLELLSDFRSTFSSSL